ncbi:MAG TPA: sigma 54-interacting transcriptional regulator, partial [Polyangiaceae bacterium]|nr:sigma 54-interacting transcriptional regulator [Polyangiaceae bacterium]
MSGPVDVTTQVLEQSTLELPTIELGVVAGPDRGLRRKLDPTGLRIGTSPAAQLRLQDATVSRMHCEIRIVDGRVRIIDLGSTNGVLLDGVRVYDAELAPGSNIQLGSTKLQVDPGDGSIAIELSPRHSFGEVLGASIEMRRLFTVLEKAAASDATILIQGETGVGKELVARAIHESSKRSHGPFVVVDCGAIAENLIESELFGHVRGAFSGAVSDRRGLFEEADGGTLFLDEIGELPASLQPRLLRVIESREVRRVGSNQNRRVDVRFLAATHRPLAEHVNDGTFREDLYYRIAVVEAQIPALRARRDDILLLAEHFFRRYAGEKETLPTELRSSLTSRAWPGNVRELRNFIERSVSLGHTMTRAPSSAPA